MKFSKSILVLIVLSALFLTYISCSTTDFNNNRGLKNLDGDVYAGSVVCAKCHNEVYNNFIHTAHFHTSSMPTEKNIKGSFYNGSNLFAYNYSTFLLMENKNDKFFETEYQNGNEQRSEQVFLVIGSGTRGQSYLYKADSELYELPVSYFTVSKSWSNSPGFPFYQPNFTRPVKFRCLECHSTYVDMSSFSTIDKEVNPKNVIFGVECESCHGAAEKHVEFQEQHPDIKEARFIINPNNLTRTQKIELCSYCHSQGKRLETAKPFTFKPGDSLNKYIKLNTSVDTSNIDVHGNQAALLGLSKCFKMSKLDCTTCHDTHKQERGDLALFSNRCMNCHNTEHKNFCKDTSLPLSVLKSDCIDCHMPAKQSKTLTVNLNQTQQKTPAIIRSHFITVYDNETKKFINSKLNSN